jgi:DNA-binding Lrp family transcriptional regulator
MLKKLPQRLLGELLKNSRRSDRELAKALDVSQPTITRTRRKLERKGIIQDYTIIPNFKKMGFEILALTFVKMRPDIRSQELFEKARKEAQKFPNVIFSSTGEGLGMTGVTVSFHKNFTDYYKTLNLLRLNWGNFTEDIQSFIISIGQREYKRFSLTCLKDVPP